MDSNAQKLAKKAISDFIHLRKGDVLVGNVPGVHFSELPAQSLNAISEMGFIGINAAIQHQSSRRKFQ